MMGRQGGDQSQLFYLFNLERRIPAFHLLHRINPVVTRILDGLREKLARFYSDIGRPLIDPELMVRMLIVRYCYGIRFERRLCEEVELHLAYVRREERAEATAPSVVVEGLQPRECLGWRGAKPDAGRDSLQRRQ
jgi:hypothetical protein